MLRALGLLGYWVEGGYAQKLAFLEAGPLANLKPVG